MYSILPTNLISLKKKDFVLLVVRVKCSLQGTKQMKKTQKNEFRKKYETRIFTKKYEKKNSKSTKRKEISRALLKNREQKLSFLNFAAFKIKMHSSSKILIHVAGRKMQRLFKK